MSGYRRVIESTTQGAVIFTISGGLTQAKVIVGECEYASVVLSTQDGADTPARKAIAEAKVAQSPGKLELTLPKEDGNTSSITVVNRHGGGFSSISVGSVGGTTVIASGDGMVISGGRGVTVNGIRIDQPGVISTGIQAEIHLPSNSKIKVRSDATFEVTGGYLAAVDYFARNSDLFLDVPCGMLEFDSHNGNLRASQPVQNVDASVHNGNIDLAQLSGDATAESHNGNIRIVALAPATVRARTHNGNVNITDPNKLGPERLKIKTRSHNGSVRTPHSS